MKRRTTVFCAIGLMLPFLGCGSGKAPVPQGDSGLPDACAMVLAPHVGNGKEDQRIIELQQRIRGAQDPGPFLERLGWAFVSKARLSYDPGYYQIAEQCAHCMEIRQPTNADALLLRGHVLHNLHRFREAEALARQLVHRREVPFDYGLLGDALMEQGRLDEAADAYQKMMDLKPGPQAYSRAAHLRWLTGDVLGAQELMTAAAQAGGPGDPESTAWAYSRLALYELQLGDLKAALEATTIALDFQKDCAPALLARSRIFLVQDRPVEAVELLQRAVSLNPLPEYQWALAEALRLTGRPADAVSVEEQLVKGGAANDPRTLALFLATQGQQVATALALAEKELKERQDVLTLDAYAWALAATGRTQEALAAMKRALSQGTEDARLFYHASLIASRAGRNAEAQRYLKKAAVIKQMLWPRERQQLLKAIAAVPFKPVSSEKG